MRKNILDLNTDRRVRYLIEHFTLHQTADALGMSRLVLLTILAGLPVDDSHVMKLRGRLVLAEDHLRRFGRFARKRTIASEPEPVEPPQESSNWDASVEAYAKGHR